MAGLTVNAETCLGCGACVESCATQALSMADDKVRIDLGRCILCGLCISSCPVGALSVSQAQQQTPNETAAGIWVAAEFFDGSPLPVTLELLGEGRKLAAARGCDLTAVCLGHGIADAAASLIRYGADRVMLLDDAALAVKEESTFAAVLSLLISQYAPETVLYGATAFGRSFAPRVAAQIGTGLTADCTALSIGEDDNLLYQTRPAFGGNLMATIVCRKRRPQMATVRPGVMEASAADFTRQGAIVHAPMPKGIRPCVRVVEEHIAEKPPGIAEAKIIVSAGRGIVSAKNMVYIHELAKLLGAEVGVSRPLVDQGWSSYAHQIGQTGATVAPQLLIACGISGAIQHLAGIVRAKTIVAINNDPDAPIFGVADYKVVGDCIEVVRQMIQQIKAGNNPLC